MRKIKFSIVIPCYNEKDNIQLLLDRFLESIIKFEEDNKFDPAEFELILVDNGSTDGTNDLFKTIDKKYWFCKVVSTRENLGYGGGIKLGLDHCKGEYIGWTHADLQADPEDVLRGFEICNNNARSDILYIKGRRRKRKFMDRAFSKGMSLFEFILFLDWYDDINSQPNIFSKSLLEQAHNAPNDFSLDLFFYYLAKKLCADIIRFDVLFPDRIYGESKWNSGILSRIKFIARTIAFSIKLKKGTMI